MTGGVARSTSPPKTNLLEPIACEFRRYRNRNRIERMFWHLKYQCRIVTRYDKTAQSFASFLNLAAIRGCPTLSTGLE